MQINIKMLIKQLHSSAPSSGNNLPYYSPRKLLLFIIATMLITPTPSDNPPTEQKQLAQKLHLIPFCHSVLEVSKSR